MNGFSVLVVGESVADALAPFYVTLATKDGEVPNPNGRWQRYEIGGRYANRLIVKGGEGLGVDQARAGDIDWVAMREANDYAYAIVDGLGFWYGPGVIHWCEPDQLSEGDLQRWIEWYWDAVMALPPESWVSYVDCSY